MKTAKFSRNICAFHAAILLLTLPHLASAQLSPSAGARPSDYLREARDAENQSADQPIYNLARAATGTTLFYLDREGTPTTPVDALQGPSVLVHDNEALAYDIRPGRAIMVVELPSAAPAHSLTFFNFGASGQATPAWAATRADADAGRWITGPAISFSQVGPVSAPLPPKTKLQFMRIQFNIERPGRISGLGIAGHYPDAPAPSPSNLVRSTNEQDPLTNVVSYGSTSSVIGVTPTRGQAPELMIDDLTDTYTELAPSTSPRAVFLDLGAAREIRQISILADSPPGDVKAFFIGNPDAVISSLGNPAQGSANPPIILTNLDLPALERDLPFVTLPMRQGQPGVNLTIQPRTSRFALFVWPPGTETIRIYELNLLGPYLWLWRPDPSPPGEAFQVPPVAFSPPAPGASPPPAVGGTPLSP